MNNSDILQIDPETTTVGEIVAQNYHAAGVFRQYGLDFCCGGGISIKKACEKKNLEPETILNELQSISWGQPSLSENYQAWEPGYLIDYIVNTHHHFVRTKTTEIAAYAAKVASVHGERHPENVEIYRQFSLLAQELLDHLEAEEERVFPLIKKVYEGRLNGNPATGGQISALREELELMVSDHTEAGDVMAGIRKLSNSFNPPADACTTYRILYQNLAGFEEDLHKHVHLENNILFKKAEKLIAAA